MCLSSLHGGPDAVDVVVVFEGLEEFADFGALVVGQFGVALGEETSWLCDGLLTAHRFRP